MQESNTQEITSKRDLLKNRLHEKYPDLNMEDEEALYGRIADDYDETERMLNESQAREKSFVDVLSRDPRTARLLMAMKDGGDVVVELARIYGPDFKAALEDPDMQAKIAEANKEFATKLAEEDKYEEEYQKNIDASIDNLDAFQAKSGMSDEEMNGVLAKIFEIVRDGVMGKFSPETIQMVMNAMNHDSDVAIAAHEGEVKGKNEKVEAKLRSNLKGDGTATLGGANSGAGRRPMPDMGALNRYGEGNSTIFERGGERRIKARR